MTLLVALLVPCFFAGVGVFTKLFCASGDVFLGLLVGDAGAMGLLRLLCGSPTAVLLIACTSLCFRWSLARLIPLDFDLACSDVPSSVVTPKNQRSKECSSSSIWSLIIDG